MGKRCCRCRVGQIVGRHVNRLHRGDRTLVRGGDALLQRTHVGGQCRLITHGRRNTAEKCRHFRTGLREAEDVVDEEQHVLALVAEMFGDGETRERDAHTRTRRLVHLADTPVRTSSWRRYRSFADRVDAWIRSSRDRDRCLRACARPRRRTPSSRHASWRCC